jgi:hypothetical protein
LAARHCTPRANAPTRADFPRSACAPTQALRQARVLRQNLRSFGGHWPDRVLPVALTLLDALCAEQARLLIIPLRAAARSLRPLDLGVATIERCCRHVSFWRWC